MADNHVRQMSSLSVAEAHESCEPCLCEAKGLNTAVQRRMQCQCACSGICVWGVGNSDVCDGVSSDQGPICPLPEPSRKAEKATCLTERELF